MAKDTLAIYESGISFMIRVNKWGGAERVLLALHKLFPHAPLYTSVYDPHTASWAKEFRIKTSFLQSFPGASSSQRAYHVDANAFESFSFDEYDVVISITRRRQKEFMSKNAYFTV